MCKGCKNFNNDGQSHVEIKELLSLIIKKLNNLEEKVDDLHSDLLDHIFDEGFEEHEHGEDEDNNDEDECHCLDYDKGGCC